MPSPPTSGASRPTPAWRSSSPPASTVNWFVGRRDRDRIRPPRATATSRPTPSPPRTKAKAEEKKPRPTRRPRPRSPRRTTSRKPKRSGFAIRIKTRARFVDKVLDKALEVDQSASCASQTREDPRPREPRRLGFAVPGHRDHLRRDRPRPCSKGRGRRTRGAANPLQRRCLAGGLAPAIRRRRPRDRLAGPRAADLADDRRGLASGPG